MKIKEGFILRNVAGSNIVVPFGDRCMDFNGMITLNETGAFIWKQLENDVEEADIVKAILAEYDAGVDEALATQCVRDFVAKLKEADCIE